MQAGQFPRRRARLEVVVRFDAPSNSNPHILDSAVQIAPAFIISAPFAWRGKMN